MIIMFKKNLMLCTMTVLALAVSACKEDKTKTEITEKSVVNGKTVESTTTTETTVDDEGNASRETHRETTVDPEGLMNKETTTEETTMEEKH